MQVIDLSGRDLGKRIGFKKRGAEIVGELIRIEHKIYISKYGDFMERWRSNVSEVVIKDAGVFYVNSNENAWTAW